MHVWVVFVLRLKSIWNVGFYGNCFSLYFAGEKGSCHHRVKVKQRGENWSPTFSKLYPALVCSLLLFQACSCRWGTRRPHDHAANHPGRLQLYQPLQRGSGPSERLPVGHRCTGRKSASLPAKCSPLQPDGLNCQGEVGSSQVWGAPYYLGEEVCHPCEHRPAAFGSSTRNISSGTPPGRTTGTPGPDSTSRGGFYTWNRSWNATSRITRQRRSWNIRRRRSWNARKWNVNITAARPYKRKETENEWEKNEEDWLLPQFNWFFAPHCNSKILESIATYFSHKIKSNNDTIQMCDKQVQNK